MQYKGGHLINILQYEIMEKDYISCQHFSFECRNSDTLCTHGLTCAITTVLEVKIIRELINVEYNYQYNINNTKYNIGINSHMLWKIQNVKDKKAYPLFFKDRTFKERIDCQ